MAHMRDAWAVAHGSADSTDSAAPTVLGKELRIDRILFSERVSVGSMERIGLAAMADPEDASVVVHASDHAGLSGLLVLQ